MIQELDEIKKTIFPWLIVFILSSLFFFSFGINQVEISGVKLPLPSPSVNSLSSQFFQKIYHDLLPSNIQLIVINPVNALIIQIQISLFLAFLFSLPLLLLRIITYISPALYKHEKGALVKGILPSIILFLMGTMFSYFLLIPLTLKLTTSYVLSIGAVSYFEINEFVSFVLWLTIASGVTFMVPIFMRILSSLGVVDSKFWIKNWTNALIVFLIFSAIITPDGTGITMVMLSLILMALYFLGILLSKDYHYNINTSREILIKTKVIK